MGAMVAPSYKMGHKPEILVLARQTLTGRLQSSGDPAVKQTGKRALSLGVTTFWVPGILAM